MATSSTPAACQPIATRLQQEQGVIKTLQLRLQRASPAEKPALINLISNRQAVAVALDEQLRACLLANPPRPPQPQPAVDLFPQQRTLPIVSLAVGLGMALEGMTVRFHNQGSGDHRRSSVSHTNTSPVSNRSSKFFAVRRPARQSSSRPAGGSFLTSPSMARQNNSTSGSSASRM